MYRDQTYRCPANTAITDFGVKHLHELKGIRNLELDHTKVTYEALERLKDKLPLLDRDFVSEFAKRRCKELGASLRGYSKGPIFVVVDDEEEREEVLQHAKWIPAEVRSKDEVSEDLWFLE